MGYFLTLISAVTYYLSFPYFSNGYPAFFSLIPFFFSLSKSNSIIKSALTGSIWGIALSMLFSIPLFYALVTEYNFSTMYSTLLIIFSVFIPYGIIYGLYGISFNYFFKKTGLLFPFIISALWILVDYIMCISPFFMPWGFAGYTQTFNIFIQISDIAGIYGVTFLLVFVNSTFTEILINKHKNNKISLLLVFIMILSTVIYSNLRVTTISNIIENDNSAKIKATVIQGNFNSKEKWDSKNTAAIVNTYINMTKEAIPESDLILWPETVLNSSDLNNLEIISGISSLLKANQIFITGSTRNNTKDKVFNSIFTADNKGLKYIYDKKILFPFTETSIAGLSSGKFLDSPSIFQTGKSKPVYKTETTTLGFTICFEAIYPEYVRKIKNIGAEILVNVANDSWFGNTYEPKMHLYSNIVRAVENRFYIIRASNSGISAIISPTGEILNSIELNSRNRMTSTINPINISSFYSKSGDWIIVISLLLIIFSLACQLKTKT